MSSNSTNIESTIPVEVSTDPNWKSKNDSISEGIRIFESRYTRASNQIERLNTVVADIRRLCAEKGIVLPELDQAIREANAFAIYKSKMERYINRIRSENVSEDEKIAIIGIMVELQEPTITVTPTQEG